MHVNKTLPEIAICLAKVQITCLAPPAIMIEARLAGIRVPLID
jgi:hypothetical protein